MQITYELVGKQPKLFGPSKVVLLGTKIVAGTIDHTCLTPDSNSPFLRICPQPDFCFCDLDLNCHELKFYSPRSSTFVQRFAT